MRVADTKGRRAKSVWSIALISLIGVSLLFLSSASGEELTPAFASQVQGEYVFVRVSLLVDSSGQEEWVGDLENLFAHAINRGDREDLVASVGSVLNSSIRRLVGGAYVTDLELWVRGISPIHPLGSDNNLEINLRFRIHNVLRKTLFGPHVLDTRFRALKTEGQATHGTIAFDPSEMLLFDFSPLNAPLEEWNRTTLGDRPALSLDVRDVVLSNGFDVVVVEEFSAVIALPPDTLSMTVSTETVLYYLWTDILEALVVPALVIAGASLFILTKRREAA